jgi:hypothetical protein
MTPAIAEQSPTFRSSTSQDELERYELIDGHRVELIWPKNSWRKSRITSGPALVKSG